MPWQSAPVAAGEQPLAFTDSAIRFVWATDSHVDDSMTTKQANVRLAVEDCNVWRPNFFLHTGDMSDNALSKLQRCFYVYQLCQRPVLTCVGNHDEIENPVGVTNYSSVIGATGFNRSPLYYATTAVSGDGTLTARVVVLDSNFYDDDPDAAPPGDSANHTPGDRMGYHATEPSGGYTHQLGVSQRAWLADVLAGDPDSDMVIVAIHVPYTATSDAQTLADILQADGRPALIVCGHQHENASAATLAAYTVLKAPAMQESGAWVRVALTLSGGVISVDAAELQHYTDPGGWTVSAPFTLPA